MKTTLAFAALAIVQVTASFCPFPATMEQSPCSASSACVTEGQLHPQCQAQIQNFCCAGTSFENYPEISSLCSNLVSCDVNTPLFRSARSNRRLGGVSGGDGTTCDELTIYGDIYTAIPGVGAILSDPTSDNAVIMSCAGTTPNTVWTATIDPLPFKVDTTLKISNAGSMDNIFDCGGAGCSVVCDNSMNKVTVTYTQGDENPVITCVESTTPLTVTFASNWLDKDEIDWTNVDEFDNLGNGVFDHLLEEVEATTEISFKVGFDLGTTGTFGAIGCGADKLDDCVISIEAGQSAFIEFDAKTMNSPNVTVLESGEVLTTAISLPFMLAAPAGAVAGFMTMLVTIAVSFML